MLLMANSFPQAQHVKEKFKTDALLEMKTLGFKKLHYLARFGQKPFFNSYMK